MTDPTTTTAAATWAPFIRFAGAFLTILGVIGTIAVIVDLTDTGFDEIEPATADIWLGILAGLTAVGVGVLVFAAGLLLDRD